MSHIRSRAGLTFILSVALFHYRVHALAASGLQRGQVVIDGRVRIDVEVARSPQAQAKGLGGRSLQKKGTGMIFPYDEIGRAHV